MLFNDFDEEFYRGSFDLAHLSDPDRDPPLLVSVADDGRVMIEGKPVHQDDVWRHRNVLQCCIELPDWNRMTAANGFVEREDRLRIRREARREEKQKHKRSVMF